MTKEIFKLKFNEKGHNYNIRSQHNMQTYFSRTYSLELHNKIKNKQPKKKEQTRRHKLS